MHKLLKIPFDAGNPTGRGGTLKSPEKILGKQGTLVKVNQSNFEESMASITSSAFNEFKAGNQVCSVGGDHSITYGLVRAASKAHSDLALIYFDAHLDCEDDFLPPSHEDVIRAIVNEKLVQPENIVIIGARKFWKKEADFIKEKKIEVIYASVKREEIEKYLREFCQKHRKIYISVDIDVFDPSIAPDTGYPEKDGFTEQEFRRFTENLDFKRIVGFDVVEVAQSGDCPEKTNALASRVIKLLLG